MLGQLFIDLHESELFGDGKAIVDAIPLYKAAIIEKKYLKEKTGPEFSLTAFFHENFKKVVGSDSEFRSNRSHNIHEHISTLWERLSRNPSVSDDYSSLIDLPHSYVVPGGRFNEIYYWDSYFTMLGLQLSKKQNLIEDMVNNFVYLIDTIGHIPNGNRTYFLSRSQPPFFVQMVKLLGLSRKLTDDHINAVQEEYGFWMNPAKGHVVSLHDGVLNRYSDALSIPREEMYGDDVALQKSSLRESKDLFSNIRAACESGWDFSSRWLEGNHLSTIQTSHILPVDLNCLLAEYERFIIDHNISDATPSVFSKRKKMINTYFWNSDLGYYVDYNYARAKQTNHLTLAGVFPLSYKLADETQAAAVASMIEQKFLAPGGVRTTTINSGEQWDAPNGWAPLQWTTVKGLDNYGYKDLASDIANRWVRMNEKVFDKNRKFVEKYNVEDLDLSAAGGEYPLQDGFGWSIGVYLSFKNYLETGQL